MDKPKSKPVLMPDRFGEAEFKRHDWVADVEVGITLDDVMEPSFWAHNAVKMSPYDQIQVRAEDGTWIAYLVVMFCERNWARVMLDRVLKVQQNTEAPTESIAHRIEWKGPHHKFGVIRTKDSEMLHSGFVTKDEAAVWLKNHEKAL